MCEQVYCTVGIIFTAEFQAPTLFEKWDFYMTILFCVVEVVLDFCS